MFVFYVCIIAYVLNINVVVYVFVYNNYLFIGCILHTFVFYMCYYLCVYCICNCECIYFLVII